MENPTPSRTVPNNETEQLRGLLYAARQLDPTTRLSVVAGTALNRFQIPAPGGVQSAFTTFGQSDFDSARPPQPAMGADMVRHGGGPEGRHRRHRRAGRALRPLQLHPLHAGPGERAGVQRRGLRRAAAAPSRAACRRTPPGGSPRDHTLRAGFQFTAERSRFRAQTALFGAGRGRRGGGPALHPGGPPGPHGLAVRVLPAGRVAGRGPFHGQFRPARRPDRAVHHQRPGLAAGQRRLAAHRNHDAPRRLRAHLHPGAAGADRHAGAGAVRRHHQRALHAWRTAFRGRSGRTASTSASRSGSRPPGPWEWTPTTRTCATCSTSGSSAAR